MQIRGGTAIFDVARVPAGIRGCPRMQGVDVEGWCCGDLKVDDEENSSSSRVGGAATVELYHHDLVSTIP